MPGILKQYQNSVDLDAQYPFMGLRSYEEKNKSQFGGRDTEIKDLFRLVEANRLTIVFGKSGVGKTSLINAGLIPELLKNYFFPIYLRIDYSSVKPPLVQTKESIYEKLKLRDAAISEIGNQTLWEYFSNQKLLDGLLTPVLIFDQFEEIFTVGKEKSAVVQEFIIELSDLAENRVPIVVQEMHQNKPESDSPRYGEQIFHLIISLREDYLANLESLSGYLPSIKNSRFRVLQMTALQALDAVMKPALHLIDKEAATVIVKKLPGITDLDFETPLANQADLKRYLVEPFLLSLICFEINEKRIESGMERITKELVTQFDIADVINGFYNKTMQGFSKNVQDGIEDSLLTESGFRKLQSLEELKNQCNIDDHDIQNLIKKRIIRKEHRDGVEYVELIHDVLTPVIKTRRDQRKIDRVEKEKKEAVAHAIELDRDKRKKRARSFGLFIFLPVVLVLLGIVSYKYITNDTKNKKAAFANRLLRIANNILDNGNDDGNYTTAALLSRTAYLINTEIKGENDYDCYTSMYKCLGYMAEFNVGGTDSNSIKVIVNDGNDVLYFGCDNGQIYKQPLGSSAELLSDLDSFAITSLAISTDKKYLAVMNYSTGVKIIDLSRELFSFTQLHSDDTTKTVEGSVCFTTSGRLVVRLDSSIIGWERKSNSWTPISWNKKLMIEGERLSSLVDNTVFRYRAGEYKSIAVYGDRIALALDSGVILITGTGDSINKITRTTFYNPTTIAFDPSGNYLMVGDKAGNLHRISIAGTVDELNSTQSTRISNIIFNSDGHYIVSTDPNNKLTIWKVDKEFKSLVPLVLPIQLVVSNGDDVGQLKCISSQKNSDYILAGYSSGKILKWPVNSAVLSQLICNQANFALDTLLVKKVLTQDSEIKKLDKYNCKNKPGI